MQLPNNSFSSCVQQEQNNMSAFVPVPLHHPMRGFVNGNDAFSPPKYVSSSQLSDGSSCYSSSSNKRDRQYTDYSFSPAAPIDIPNTTESVSSESSSTASSRSSKRIRTSSYQPASVIPKTVTSSIGSLVGGALGKQNNMSVSLRRNNSFGQLDNFIGQDSMDLEVNPQESRPRRMSL